MPGGIEEEKPAIQSMRQPGQWMPVGRIEGGERPLNSVPIEVVLDVRIPGDVLAVIQNEEWEPVHRVISCEAITRTMEARTRRGTVFVTQVDNPTWPGD